MDDQWRETVQDCLNHCFAAENQFLAVAECVHQLIEQRGWDPDRARELGQEVLRILEGLK